MKVLEFKKVCVGYFEEDDCPNACSHYKAGKCSFFTHQICDDVKRRKK